jgi:hypothetical protein
MNGCPIIDLAEARFRRRAATLIARGPRPMTELLVHVARDCLLGTYLDQLVERYLAVPEAALDITGAREMPPELPS